MAVQKGYRPPTFTMLSVKISATSQSVSHSAALKSATYGLALVTRITAGSETLENHVYDGF